MAPLAMEPPIHIRLRILLPVTILVLVNAIPSVDAHAVRRDSFPTPAQRLAAAPDEVWIEFSEPVDTRYTRIRLLDANGTRVPDAPSHVEGRRASRTVPTNLSHGAYFLQWETYSIIDGHLTRGQWGFAIGQADPPLDVSEERPRLPFTSVAAKTFLLGGLGLLTGFWTTIMILGRSIDDADLTRLRRTAMGAALLHLMGLLTLWLVQADQTSTDPFVYLATGFGKGLAGRVALASLVVPILLWVPAHAMRLALPPVLIPLLLLQGATSHAAANDGNLGTLLDAIHLGAGLTWAGALWFIVMLARTIADRGLFGRTTIAFSRIAFGLVATVVVTGLLLTTVTLGAPSLWASRLGEPYGLVLIYKVLAALTMIGFGAVNHVTYVRTQRAQEHGAIRDLFRANVRREAINGLLILVLAAILTNLTPP